MGVLGGGVLGLGVLVGVLLPLLSMAEHEDPNNVVVTDSVTGMFVVTGTSMVVVKPIRRLPQ